MSQMAKVAVKFIEDHPQRQHERFIVLAVESFVVAFPCKK
jgi:hypothetical protein